MLPYTTQVIQVDPDLLHLYYLNCEPECAAIQMTEKRGYGNSAELLVHV